MSTSAGSSPREHEHVARTEQPLGTLSPHGDVVPARVQQLPAGPGAETVRDHESPGGHDVPLGHPPQQRHDAAEQDEHDDQDRDRDVEPGEFRAEHPEAEPAGGRHEHDEDRGADESSGVWPEPGDDELGGQARPSWAHA
ncbi:hypothetical protein DEJ36_03320 [Curtobacterium sp. MCPF17_052]|nr:hypothetical protein [Curtobacterium sp. MCPF17_052]WIB13036.1 hypothetical protein DEJ36_03320 [Curtobacterium sp. MCPF17_052]